jgi:hypothetical protein
MAACLHVTNYSEFLPVTGLLLLHCNITFCMFLLLLLQYYCPCWRRFSVGPKFAYTAAELDTAIQELLC